MEVIDFANLLRSELEKRGLSQYRAAVDADLPDDAIRYVLQGREPKLSRVIEICEALGLEFHIGPSHNGKTLNKTPFNSENGATDPAPAYALDPEIDNAEHVLVPKLDIQLAAGHGAAATDERPVGMLAFRREWMSEHNLQPGQVSAVEISGDSMTPGLDDGDTILVDHTRARLMRGLVVAARVGNDLFVKRLEQTPDEDWLLISDNHEYAPLALGKDDAVIGEVVWRGRWFEHLNN